MSLSWAEIACGGILGAFKTGGCNETVEKLAEISGLSSHIIEQGKRA